MDTMQLALFVGFNLFPVLVIIFSYIYTLAATLKLSSTTGRQLAFSTRASHLGAVTIFHGILSSYMDLQPHNIWLSYVMALDSHVQLPDL